MRVRGYVVLGLAAVAVAGCSDDDEQRTMATKPASTGATPDQQATAPAEPAGRRPVRLLPLGRFDQPTYVAAPRGDKRRFVVELEGRIRVVQGGHVLRTPFLDISDRVIDRR